AYDRIQAAAIQEISDSRWPISRRPPSARVALSDAAPWSVAPPLSRRRFRDIHRAGPAALALALELGARVGRAVAHMLAAKDAYALVRGLALVKNLWKNCETDGIESLLRKHRIKLNDATRRYLHYPEHQDDDGFERNGREQLTTPKSEPVTGYVW